MRLIDADVLIEKIKTDKFTHVRNDYSSGYNDGIFHSGVVADNLPTVDAVPVVRCKDCVYLSHLGMTHFDKVDSGYLCSRTEDDEIELTDYCSKARRKDA